MCSCKQKKSWSIGIDEDEDAMAMGYDGDLVEDEDTSNWMAYSIRTEYTCDRCDETETHDSLGAVWVTPENDKRAVFSDIVKVYGMLPRHVDQDKVPVHMFF